MRAHAPFAAAVAAAVVAAPAARAEPVEQPAYTVEARHEGWEIRQYAPTLTAEVTVASPYDRAVSDGFRRLAAYIFGGNQASTQIAMTAPVGATPQADGEAWTITFTMPAAWTAATLPAPNDPLVTVVARPGGRVAARRFAGFADADQVDAERQRLFAALDAAGLRPAGWTVAMYDPPWTPPPLRRNEILVTLANDGR